MMKSNAQQQPQPADAKLRQLWARHCQLAQDNLDLDEVLAAAEDSMFGGGSAGFCVACGAEHDGCEPDAERYVCSDCEQHTVYGAEELLIWLT